MQKMNRCCLSKRSMEQIANVKNIKWAKIYQANTNKNVAFGMLLETKYISRQK